MGEAIARSSPKDLLEAVLKQKKVKASFSFNTVDLQMRVPGPTDVILAVQGQGEKQITSLRTINPNKRRLLFEEELTITITLRSTGDGVHSELVSLQVLDGKKKRVLGKAEIDIAELFLNAMQQKQRSCVTRLTLDKCLDPTATINFVCSVTPDLELVPTTAAISSTPNSSHTRPTLDLPKTTNSHGLKRFSFFKALAAKKKSDERKPAKSGNNPSGEECVSLTDQSKESPRSAASASTGVPTPQNASDPNWTPSVTDDLHDVKTVENQTTGNSPLAKLSARMNSEQSDKPIRGWTRLQEKISSRKFDASPREVSETSEVRHISSASSKLSRLRDWRARQSSSNLEKDAAAVNIITTESSAATSSIAVKSSSGTKEAADGVRGSDRGRGDVRDGDTATSRRHNDQETRSQRMSNQNRLRIDGDRDGGEESRSSGGRSGRKGGRYRDSATDVSTALHRPATHRGDDRSAPATHRGDDRSAPATHRGDDRSAPATHRGDDRSSRATHRGDDRSAPATHRGDERSSPATHRGDDRGSPATHRGDDRSSRTTHRGDDRSSRTTHRGDERSSRATHRGDDRGSPVTHRGDDRSSRATHRGGDRSSRATHRGDDRSSCYSETPEGLEHDQRLHEQRRPCTHRPRQNRSNRSTATDAASLYPERLPAIASSNGVSNNGDPATAAPRAVSVSNSRETPRSVRSGHRRSRDQSTRSAVARVQLTTVAESGDAMGATVDLLPWPAEDLPNGESNQTQAAAVHSSSTVAGASVASGGRSTRRRRRSPRQAVDGGVDGIDQGVSSTVSEVADVPRDLPRSSRYRPAGEDCQLPDAAIAPTAGENTVGRVRARRGAVSTTVASTNLSVDRDDESTGKQHGPEDNRYWRHVQETGGESSRHAASIREKRRMANRAQHQQNAVIEPKNGTISATAKE